MVHVVYTHMSVTEPANELVAYWMPQMPPVIREKINQYRRWQDAQCCLFGKALLQRCLQCWYPSCSLYQLEYTSYNRPYINQGNLDFNISHSGAYIVCAISDTCRVGIDIEEMRNIDFDIYSTQFPQQEWQVINTAADKRKAFYRSWTQLEALIKANGKGLSIPLKTIQVNNGMAQVEDKQWYLQELALSDQYACHLALDILPVSIQYDSLSLQTAGALPA